MPKDGELDARCQKELIKAMGQVAMALTAFGTALGFAGQALQYFASSVEKELFDETKEEETQTDPAFSTAGKKRVRRKASRTNHAEAER